MYSNCLIEALKAKIKDPNVKVHVLPPKLNYGMLHFYWVKGNTVFHYLDLKKNKTVSYRVFHPFFKGVEEKASLRSFEKLLFTRMLENCWTQEQQIRYAKKHGFHNLKPFYEKD